MRSSWIRVDPKSNDWCPDKKRRGTETWERRPCEEGGRDWSDATISQGTPRIASSHQKPREGHGTDSSSEPPEGTNPANTLTLDFWPPE